MPKCRDIAFVFASLWLMASCLGLMASIGVEDGLRSIRVAAWAGVMLLALGVMLLAWCAGRVVDYLDHMERPRRIASVPPVATHVPVATRVAEPASSHPFWDT